MVRDLDIMSRSIVQKIETLWPGKEMIQGDMLAVFKWLQRESSERIRWILCFSICVR